MMASVEQDQGGGAPAANAGAGTMAISDSVCVVDDAPRGMQQLLQQEHQRAADLQQENAALRARLGNLQQQQRPMAWDSGHGDKRAATSASAGSWGPRSSQHDDLLQRLRDHVKAALSEGGNTASGASGSNALCASRPASDSSTAADASAGSDTAAHGGDQQEGECPWACGGDGEEGAAMQVQVDSLRHHNSRLARSVTVLRQLVEGPRRRWRGAEQLRASVADAGRELAEAGQPPAPAAAGAAAALCPVRASTGSIPTLASAAAHWGGARLLGQGLSNDAAAQRARQSLQSQLQQAGEKLRSSIQQQQEQQQQRKRRQFQEQGDASSSGAQEFAPALDSSMNSGGGGLGSRDAGMTNSSSPAAMAAEAAGSQAAEPVGGSSRSSSRCSGSSAEGPPQWSAEQLVEENALLSRQLQVGVRQQGWGPAHHAISPCLPHGPEL